MKLQKRLFICTIILVVSAFNLKPENTNILPTKLRVTVLDELGNFVQGATVTLYETEDDYKNSIHAIDTLVTDDKGRAQFKDLRPIPYFVDARKGDLNNDAQGVKTAALLEGRLNKVNTIID